MLQKIKNLFREIGVLSLSIALAFVLFMGVVIVKGWTEPTLDAPNGNVGAPINTGSAGQIKSGGLILNSGGATNGLIVQSGKVGIGTESPTQKLDVVGYIKGQSGLCIGNDCKTGWDYDTTCGWRGSNGAPIINACANNDDDCACPTGFLPRGFDICGAKVGCYCCSQN